MATVTKLQIVNRIIDNARVLGNTDTGLKEFCSDLINDYVSDKKDWQILSDNTFLSVGTLKRLSLLTETEQGDPYRPQADTCERVMRFFNCEVYFRQVKIKSKYQNKEKHFIED